MPVTFTEITDLDVTEVVALWRVCGLVRPWNDPVADIADARAGATSTVLVAHDDEGRVVASVMTGCDGHRGWLYYVAVAPHRQGAGLGRGAVVAAEQWLGEHGARKVQLLVRQTNEQVIGFYEHLGYADQQCVVLGHWLRRPDDVDVHDVA